MLIFCKRTNTKILGGMQTFKERITIVLQIKAKFSGECNSFASKRKVSRWKAKVFFFTKKKEKKN